MSDSSEDAETYGEVKARLLEEQLRAVRERDAALAQVATHAARIAALEAELVAIDVVTGRREKGGALAPSERGETTIQGVQRVVNWQKEQVRTLNWERDCARSKDAALQEQTAVAAKWRALTGALGQLMREAAGDQQPEPRQGQW